MQAKAYGFMDGGKQTAPLGTSRKLNHEQRMLCLALLTGFPSLVIALLLLWGWPNLPIGPTASDLGTTAFSWLGPLSDRTQWTVTLLLLGFWVGCAFLLQQKLRFPLLTVSNLLAAIREGDYSIRARGASRDDALGEVITELNSLGRTLRDQRLGALEATALLSKVMTEIDVAVFTFDAEQKLRLVNRAGERLLAQPASRILGNSAVELGLADCLLGDAARTIDTSFPGGMGRWGMRRSSFREQGVPHQLLVLTDLSRTLREEERQAWQRLLRVLGHELNNSLAPIKSIAGSLETLLTREPLPADWLDDTQRGLGVISARSAALNRFVEAYTRLARLPAPTPRPVEIDKCLEKVLRLETRLAVHLQPGPFLVVSADPDQLEQLLINLVRNAVDASLETKGNVRAGWLKAGSALEVWVEDDGLGLSTTTNLFVPFFTTKQGGSGIGLVLCRQIAEAHSGSLTLTNREAGRGCIARLRLPLEATL